VEIEIEAKECAGKLGKLSFLPCHQNASYKYARGEHIDLHYSHPNSPLSSRAVAEQRAGGNKRAVQKLEASWTILSATSASLGESIDPFLSMFFSRVLLEICLYYPCTV
jgi:hypothetical protein